MTAIPQLSCGVAALGMVLLTGCDAGTEASLPTVAALQVVAGDGQVGPAGGPLPDPLTVRVTDSAGRSVRGVPVRFEVTAGAGSVTEAIASSDDQGIVSTVWTLGTAAGVGQGVEARVAGAGGSALVVQLTATAVAGEAVSLLVEGAASTLSVGAHLQLTATPIDAHGNASVGVGIVEWSTPTPAILSVSRDGAVRGLAAGAGIVDAVSVTLTGRILLQVEVPDLDPSRIGFELGVAEVVFSYRNDRCETMDLPDMTARAIRMADGTIVLYSGNAPRNYASFGPEFDSLRRSCNPTLESVDDHTAESFTNQEWVATVYREGGTYHALVHNEYHDPVADNCLKGDTSPANPCWYNAITYAWSGDGRSFTRAASPDHVLAGPPQRWDPSGDRAPGPYGYFTPSNIVRRADGFYYALFFVIPDRDQQTKRGSCLMRTTNLADGASWRAWDGSGFTIAMPSPYTAAATGRECTIVLPSDVNGSLTYNTFLERYIYVGSTRIGQDGGIKCGFVFTLSEDLVTWTAPRVFKENPLPLPPCGQPGQHAGSEHYPALIDHEDSSINFEFTGRTPYVYYTRYNDQGLNRDLLRAPVTIVLDP